MDLLSRLIASALLPLVIAGTAGAQAISASADRTRVEVGERVAFTIEVEGREAAGAVIQPPAADGLVLVSRTPSLRALTSINGRARLTMRWLYRAERPGPGEIGAARVFAGGRTRMTDAIPITVVRGSAAAPIGPMPPAGRGTEELY